MSMNTLKEYCAKFGYTLIQIDWWGMAILQSSNGVIFEIDEEILLSHINRDSCYTVDLQEKI